MKFEDLKLEYGCTLQLQTGSSDVRQQKVSCRLIGCVPGRNLLVTPPRGNALLRTGQKLVARVMVGNGIALFPVTIESTVSTPLPMLYLSFPGSVNFKEIRGATRVNVTLAVQAKNLSGLDDARSYGQVSDISTSGAKIELAHVLGKVGDELKLSGQVTIGPLQRELSLTCRIRSRIERSTREQDDEFPAVYGVEFTEVDEDNLLELHAYVYSQMATL